MATVDVIPGAPRALRARWGAVAVGDPSAGLHPAAWRRRGRIGAQAGQGHVHA
jgi:hypothetical protein